jgi:hypothetical protein
MRTRIQRVITLQKVDIPQSNVEVLVYAPEKAKHTLRINKAYLEYMREHGFSPLVDTNKLIKKADQVIHHIKDNQARKRFKNNLKLSKKLIGYEAYVGGYERINLLNKPVRSMQEINQVYFTKVGKRITADKSLSARRYYEIGYLHCNKKAAPEMATA